MTEPPQPAANDPLRRLAGVLALEAQIRKATTRDELFLTMVNDIQQAVPVRQAVLFIRPVAGHWRVKLFSGVPMQETSTPLGDWLEQVVACCLRDRPQERAHLLASGDLPGALAASWRQWLPARVVWQVLPLPPAGEGVALLLARDAPFVEGDLQLLQHLIQAYGYAWEKLHGRRGVWSGVWSRFSRKSRRWGVVVAVSLLLLVPVRLSVLATASVVPADPLVVSAPLEGVVRTFHVTPNQMVTREQPLFSLDSADLESRRDMAIKALAAEQADFLRARRKGFVDDASKAEAAFLEARVALKAAEAAYIEEQLAKVTVRAMQDGIAVFNDANDWLGKPVRMGERILYLAEPSKTEIEGWIAVSDAIPLAEGAGVTLFLDTQPLDPLAGVLYQQAYEARDSPEKILGFSFRARFAPPAAVSPRIGLKGSAKIQGEWVTLFYYLMRRPMGALRRMAGL